MTGLRQATRRRLIAVKREVGLSATPESFEKVREFICDAKGIRRR